MGRRCLNHSAHFSFLIAALWRGQRRRLASARYAKHIKIALTLADKLHDPLKFAFIVARRREPRDRALFERHAHLTAGTPYRPTAPHQVVGADDEGERRRQPERIDKIDAGSVRRQVANRAANAAAGISNRSGLENSPSRD